jgi:hypothetical protein
MQHATKPPQSSLPFSRCHLIENPVQSLRETVKLLLPCDGRKRGTVGQTRLHLEQDCRHGVAYCQTVGSDCDGKGRLPYSICLALVHLLEHVSFLTEPYAILGSSGYYYSFMSGISLLSHPK